MRERRVGSWGQVRRCVRRRVEEFATWLLVRRERAWVKEGFCWEIMQPWMMIVISMDACKKDFVCFEKGGGLRLGIEG